MARYLVNVSSSNFERFFETLLPYFVYLLHIVNNYVVIIKNAYSCAQLKLFFKLFTMQYAQIKPIL